MNRRGDVEQLGSQGPDTPLPSASSLPGGHATGVDSGHRLRTETRSALTQGLRPPTRRVRGPVSALPLHLMLALACTGAGLDLARRPV
jgi:hypothetical protein